MCAAVTDPTQETRAIIRTTMRIMTPGSPHPTTAAGAKQSHDIRNRSAPGSTPVNHDGGMTYMIYLICSIVETVL